MEQSKKAFLRIEKLTKGKIEGYEQWEEISIGTDAVLIARPDKNPDSIQPDIKIIGDDYITRSHDEIRSHAEIYYSPKDGCYMLRDNGSRNGTFLNKDQIEIDRPYPLKDNDEIGLAKISGEMRVIFKFRTSIDTLGPWSEVDGPIQKTGLYVLVRARKVFVNGEHIPLTKIEFDMIRFLFEHRGEACSKDDIAFGIWEEKGASNELIAKHISLLRKKIEQDPVHPRYIKTVHDRYLLDVKTPD